MKLDMDRLAPASAKVGPILENMPHVESTGWAKHVASSASEVTDVESLISELDAGENEHNFGLALLLRECLVDAPAVFTSINALPSFDSGIGDVRVCHGDLVIDGGLSVEDNLIVTGDLRVSGVLDIQSEWNSTFVCGNVSAYGAAIGKVQFLMGGDLAIEQAITVMEGYVGAGGTARAALNIEWLGDIHAKKGVTFEHHFTSDDVQEYGRATRAKLAEIVAPELVNPDDEDDDVFSIVHALAERMAEKLPIWRPAELPRSAAPAMIPRLAAALEREDAEVDLAEMRLPSLPPEIGNLKGVTKLNLDHNSLESLPPEIGKLTELKELWIDHNRLTSLPASLGALEKLHMLIAVDNRLTDLPDEFANLKSLRRINLDDNRFTALPKALFGLKKLMSISLMRNQVKEIDEGFGQLAQLETLYIGPDLQKIGDVFGNLTKLENLQIYGGDLSTSELKLARATGLRKLRLQSVKLAAVPPDILEMTWLEELDLPFNAFHELPSFARMTNLKKLDVSDMKLTTLHPSLFELPNLKCIYATKNEISKDEIARLYALGKEKQIQLYLN